MPGGGGFRTGFFPKGNVLHLSQKSKGEIPHLLNLECIGGKGVLRLRSPKDTEYNDSASNNPKKTC